MSDAGVARDGTGVGGAGTGETTKGGELGRQGGQSNALDSSTLSFHHANSSLLFPHPSKYSPPAITYVLPPSKTRAVRHQGACSAGKPASRESTPGPRPLASRTGKGDCRLRGARTGD